MPRVFLVLILLVFAGCDSREHSATPRYSGKTELVGRVVDASDRPVVGAVVLAAMQDAEATWPLDAPAWADKEREVCRVVTDVEGRFQIDELEPGLIQLSLRAKEFALRELVGIPLDVGTRHDLGDVRLQPGTRLSGAVLSSERKPVAAAAILYLRPEATPPHAHAHTGVLVGHTNARGEFHLTQLEPGPFTLAIDAPQEAPFRLSGFATDEQDLGEIVLPASSAIRGVVRSLPLGDLSDMQVVAIPTRAVPFVRRHGSVRGLAAPWLEGYAEATIGEKGAFFLTDLLPDQDYSLRVLAPEDELRISDYWSPPKLVRSGTEDAVLSVHPSVRMDFRVVNADTGDPVAGFEYRWIGARNLPRKGVDYLRATDASRRVRLRVTAPGFEDYESQPLALIAGNALTPFRVELIPGDAQFTEPLPTDEPPKNWIDTLPGFEPAPVPSASSPTHGRELLSGTIHVDGEPLVGALLRLYPPRQREAFFASHENAIQFGRTDRTGRFQLHGIPQGENLLTIEHESRAQVALRRVAPGEWKLELENHTLHGRVVAADGSPIAKAKVHLPQHWKREAQFEAVSGDGDQNVIAWRELRTPPTVAITDAAGRFTLTGLESGSALTLGARSAHHGVGTLRLANLDQEATILLSSNSTLTVDGVDSRPLERALGVAWRWGRDYGHEIRFAYERPLNREFRGLSADEWTVFHANIDGWGEISSLRILAPVLLDPVGDSHVRVRH